MKQDRSSQAASQSAPSDQDINKLQQLLLEAVLAGQSLPGSNQVLHFPDLHFVIGQPNVILSDENLVGPVFVKNAPKPIHILASNEIHQLTQSQGDITYLKFRSPDINGNTVQMTLEAKLVPRDSNRRAMGLSSVQVKFQKVGDQWQVTEDPAAMAV